ncbi:MAG: glucosyl-3-phosphoglycerate synthase [Chitinispirillaceae bacterium]|nr:glucosyl-3-phosphoglycerate synthase [Chitinispirillaceae bacterium]
MADTAPGRENLFHCRDFQPLCRLAERKRMAGVSASLVIPARNEAGTIGAIVSHVRHFLMEKNSLVDELVVMDGDSDDATARIAEEAGATVHPVSLTGPHVPWQGKGAAMWKSLFVTRGDFVLFIDADTEQFDSAVIAGLLGPLIAQPDIFFVKAFYRRPLVIDGRMFDDHGGRITEILVRPLLHLFLPELSCIRQPLGGEYSFRREVLESLPFHPGYGIEIGLIIDFFFRYGLDHFAQVDTEKRIHRNRTVGELGSEAGDIARTLLRKFERHGLLITRGTAPGFRHDAMAFRLDGDAELPAKNGRTVAMERSLSDG